MSDFLEDRPRLLDAEAKLAKSEAACAEMRSVISELMCPCPSCDPKHRIPQALSSDCGKDFVPKSELEKAQAACAEMRSQLEIIQSFQLRFWSRSGVTSMTIEHALSTDCGKDWLPPEKARVLVETLQNIQEYWNGAEESAVDAIEYATDLASKTLAAVKEDKP